MAQVTIEGTTLDMDDEVAGKDATLKAALAPFYPAVTNADIKRETKNGVMSVNVIKRAGTKGAVADVIAALSQAPEEINPALLLARRIDAMSTNTDLDFKAAMFMQEEIAAAIERGTDSASRVTQARSVLVKAVPIPSLIVPTGF